MDSKVTEKLGQITDNKYLAGFYYNFLMLLCIIIHTTIELYVYIRYIIYYVMRMTRIWFFQSPIETVTNYTIFNYHNSLLVNYKNIVCIKSLPYIIL